MSSQSKSRSRLRTFMLHSSLQPYVTWWPEGLTGCVWGRQFFSKRIWDESQRCQIMISRTSNPYHNTGLSRIPSTPFRAITAPAGSGLVGGPQWKAFCQGLMSPSCTAAGEYGKDATMPTFINCAYRYGNKKNFSCQDRPFPKGDNKIRSFFCCWRANLEGKDWS